MQSEWTIRSVFYRQKCCQLTDTLAKYGQIWVAKQVKTRNNDNIKYTCNIQSNVGIFLRDIWSVAFFTRIHNFFFVRLVYAVYVYVCSCLPILLRVSNVQLKCMCCFSVQFVVVVAAAATTTFFRSFLKGIR